MPTTIIGADEVGTIARYQDEAGGFSFLYYQTACCGADATGVSITADNPAGIACRACYRPIDPRMAGQPAEPAPPPADCREFGEQMCGTDRCVCQAPRIWRHRDGLVTFQW